MRFYVVSDRLAAVPARLQVRLLDFNGRVLFQQIQAVQIEPLTSKVYLDIPRKKLLKGHDAKQVVLSCEVQAADGTILAANTHYFATPKEMTLPHPDIATTWKPLTDSTYQLTLQSKTLARDINLTLAESDGFFEDNYFDLLPDQPKTVTFRSTGPTSAQQLKQLKQQLRLQSLADAF